MGPAETLNRIQGWLSLLGGAAVMVEITFPPPFSLPLVAFGLLWPSPFRSSLFHYLRKLVTGLHLPRACKCRVELLWANLQGLTCFERYLKHFCNNLPVPFICLHILQRRLLDQVSQVDRDSGVIKVEIIRKNNCRGSFGILLLLT